MHDKVLCSDLDIPVTHISYTDSDLTGPVLMLKQAAQQSSMVGNFRLSFPITPLFSVCHANCGEGEILLTVICFYLTSYSYNFTPFNLFYGQQFTPSRSYNLGQHKWKTQTPPLPPPKSRMGKWRVFALRAASSLILGGRGFAVPFYFVQDCSSQFLGIVDVYLPSCKQQKVSPRPLIQVKTLAYH